MSAKEEQFLKQLRATFEIEAAEHLQTIGAGLLELEHSSAPEAQRKDRGNGVPCRAQLEGCGARGRFHRDRVAMSVAGDVFAAWKRGESIPICGRAEHTAPHARCHYHHLERTGCNACGERTCACRTVIVGSA